MNKFFTLLSLLLIFSYSTLLHGEESLAEQRTRLLQFVEQLIAKHPHGRLIDDEYGYIFLDRSPAQIGLVLQIDGLSDGTLLRELTNSPIGSLSLRYGTLQLEGLQGLDVTELNLRCMDLKGDENVIGELSLRCFCVKNMVWTNVVVLGRVHTLEDLQLAAPEKAQPVSVEPLEKLNKLKRLYLDGSWGPDFSCLTNMPLSNLDIVWNPAVKDLSALHGLQLTSLDLRHTAVSNIDFVAGMPLKSLNISFTSVRDIGALRGMPLESLNMEGQDIPDLSPLEGMHLKYLTFNPSAATNGLDVVKRLSRTIRSIGTHSGDPGSGSFYDGAPPEEFWIRMDMPLESYESNKPKGMKTSESKP